jgi:hypothetical protein
MKNKKKELKKSTIRQKNGKSFVLLNIKNYKENKCLSGFYSNESFDFD